jgi:hypothetical protein
MKKMLLLTKEIRERLIKNFEENEASHGEKSFKVVVKLFNPTGPGFWFLTELNPANNIAFGGAKISDWDLGSISMDELENLKVPPFGLHIERDKFFKSNKHTLQECEKMVENR